MKPYNHPNIQHIKKRTIKEETRYYLQCRGYDATDQEIQRAMPTKVRHRFWRGRKHPPGIVNGWSIHSYLLHNKIAKPVKNLKQDTTSFKAIETEIIKKHPPH